MYKQTHGQHIQQMKDKTNDKHAIKNVQKNSGLIVSGRQVCHVYAVISYPKLIRMHTKYE